jgi:hypothetical protein
MPRYRVRISCTGLSPREAKRNTPALESDLLARPDIQNPLVTYDNNTETLLIILEAESTDPDQLADAALETISESIIAAFQSQSEQRLLFKIEESTPLPFKPS